MNSEIQSLKDRIRKKASEKNVEFNIMMIFYIYDRFIARLSKSLYRDNFVLKGGFYLSTLFGLDNRTTMDIDTSLRNTDLTEENIRNMISDIITIDLDDNIKYEIEKIETIRDEDEYGGYRVHLLYHLGNEKNRIHIDIATGDPIYPEALKYSYTNFLTGEEYKIFAYNLETALSEKIETILKLGELSSRMKDYYDIYAISKFGKDKIDLDVFRHAAEKTFAKRNFDLLSNRDLEVLKESSLLKIRWNAYIKSHSFAKRVKLEDTINCLEEFIDLLVTVIE